MVTINRSWKYAAISAVALVVLAVVAIVFLRARGHADLADGQAVALLEVKSASFADEGVIPTRLTCKGEGLSPALELSSVPPGTKSMAMVMDDTYSPFGFVHWLLYNIPSQTRTIPEGASSRKTLPGGASEGIGSDGTARYFGPCPPGSSAHRYVISVYALSVGAELMPGLTKKRLADAVKGHVLAEGKWAGTFSSSSN